MAKKKGPAKKAAKMRKTVTKHLREDIKTFKKEAGDDKKLIKKLKRR
ncbi:MAG: hypothetical protein PVF17_00430 [Ignavibacteria bacterium]|jgi:hypothetical protein